MTIKNIIACLSLILIVFSISGQEDSPLQEASVDEIVDEKNGENMLIEADPGINETKKKKKPKKEKLKPKKEGPLLIAANAKQKLSREFEIGEKVSYKTKTSKKTFRGAIEEIDKEFIKIDGKRVKVSSLVMVRKKFMKTMGWRTVGLTRFAIGTGVAAVGIGIAVFSFQQIDPNSTVVIWGALGTVFGTGVGLVGTHLMLKGSKGMFQSSKLKKDKGWKFSTKL